MSNADQAKPMLADSRTMYANSIAWLPAVIRARLISYVIVASASFLVLPGAIATLVGANRTIVTMFWIAPWFLALAWLQMNRGGGAALLRRIGFRLLCKRFSDPEHAAKAQPGDGRVRWQGGSVAGPANIPGLLEPVQGVFRRLDLVITIDRTLMKPLELTVTHQAGEPFILVDASGNRVKAEVDDNSFLFVEPMASIYLKDADAAAFLSKLNILEELGYSDAKILAVLVSEHVLKPSDEVFVLGTPTTSVDQNVERLPRDAPIARALASAPDVPLLIVPADARSAASRTGHA